MNIANLTKAEIIKRANFKCKHSHNGLEHPQCFVSNDGKIGFFDIETTNLKANFGIVICYSLKSEFGEVITNAITPEEILNETYDKRLLKELCVDLRKFSRIATYYGKRFDVPFVRTRCLKFGLDFPPYMALWHTDVYDIIRRKCKFHSNRLQVACDFFGIESKGHPINFEVWMKCLAGKQEAIDYVIDHNKEDVVCLEELWHIVMDTARVVKSSI